MAARGTVTAPWWEEEWGRVRAVMDERYPYVNTFPVAVRRWRCDHRPSEFQAVGGTDGLGCYRFLGLETRWRSLSRDKLTNLELMSPALPLMLLVPSSGAFQSPGRTPHLGFWPDELCGALTLAWGGASDRGRALDTLGSALTYLCHLPRHELRALESLLVLGGWPAVWAAREARPWLLPP